MVLLALGGSSCERAGDVHAKTVPAATAANATVEKSRKYFY